MKNNDERVRSILEKAKKYKHQRLQIISSITMAICICAIVLVGNKVMHKKSDNDFLIMENDNAESIDEKAEENLIAFNSKEELIQVLKDTAEKYNNIQGNYFDFDEAVIAEDSATINSVMKAPESDFSGAENKQYSKTNIQEENVDEADIIKTNGKYIYYLNQSKRILYIFEDKEDKINLYLDDKYIIVVGSSMINQKTLNSDKFNYEVYTNITNVLIYDINSYELLRKVETEGNIVSSRKIGSSIYLVTNKYISFYDFDENNVLPIYKDSNISGDYLELPISKVRCFANFAEDSECNYMIITSFNLDDMKSDVNINSYLGAGNEIYCSTENLYVTKTVSKYIGPTISGEEAIGGVMISYEPSNYEINTSIHKFKIEDGNIKYIATGKVPGSLLNQFSMGEYDGYFRITTTNYESGNNIYVLDESLNEIGKLEGLASGEKIYSTRFMGDKAYVVTYKTVDPLFVIDLSNPKKPEVLGELKIPGYSSYLHPLSDKYILGFGEDSVEKSYLNWEGEMEVIAYSNGLKMSIFDVSDFSNPKEIHTIKIGARGSYSELLYNHKALLIDVEKGIIAFPATVTEDAGKYNDGTPMYGDVIFNGALVYNFSIENGFNLKGKLSHDKNDNVERIIYIDDKYYTVSSKMIKSWSMETTEEIDSFKF